MFNKLNELVKLERTNGGTLSQNEAPVTGAVKPQTLMIAPARGNHQFSEITDITVKRTMKQFCVYLHEVFFFFLFYF